MFDTMKVAQKIREARNGRNMTQMALADEMGVSYQAVSNWERGNSMPDISKLEQLCNVLHITVYELLGTDNPQTKTVSKILDKEELPELEEIAEIASMVDPEMIKEAVEETAKKRRINWNAIMQMAPFLDTQTLDEILENAEPGNYNQIIALAPFLGRETLEKLVLQCQEEADMGMITALAPFLGRDTLDRLVEKLLQTGNVGDLSCLYPFLGREIMRKLVKKMMDDGDFDSMRNAAVFL